MLIQTPGSYEKHHECEFDVTTLNRMISFMYTGDYQLRGPKTPINTDSKDDFCEPQTIAMIIGIQLNNNPS